MKVLSLTQPWASLVAYGAKKFETRSWSTTYRGPLAIHAAKGFPKRARELCFTEPFKAALAGITEADLPRGTIIATVELYNVTPMGSLNFLLVNEWEAAFGDWSADRYVWILRNVHQLPYPIPAKRMLGLWKYELPEEMQ